MPGLSRVESVLASSPTPSPVRRGSGQASRARGDKCGGISAFRLDRHGARVPGQAARRAQDRCVSRCRWQRLLTLAQAIPRSSCPSSPRSARTAGRVSLLQASTLPLRPSISPSAVPLVRASSLLYVSAHLTPPQPRPSPSSSPTAPSLSTASTPLAPEQLPCTSPHPSQESTSSSSSLSRTTSTTPSVMTRVRHAATWPSPETWSEPSMVGSFRLPPVSILPHDSQDSRSLLTASYRSLLHSYILSPINDPPPPALLHLLNSPRASLLNTSYLDDDSGSSILHEAALRKDLRLIELAVRAGADVFLRNRRGKTAYESVKDDKVRVFLRQCLSIFLSPILLLTHIPQLPIMTNLSSPPPSLHPNLPLSRVISTSIQTSHEVIVLAGLFSPTVSSHASPALSIPPYPFPAVQYP
jgi:hypothetical protein